MASCLHPTLTSLRLPTPTPTLPPTPTHTPTPTLLRRLTITAGGPRSNRGPLMKGRILSIEAIHVIQALKRAERTNPTTLPLHVNTLLPRLLKADLISTFKELVRQQHLKIALIVFSSIKSEFKIELTLYADLVNALTSKGLFEEVDKLVGEIVEEGRIDIEDKGLVKFVKALVEGERRESTVEIYGLLKKCGWGEGFEVDEYVAEVLSKGLRRMGEEKLADEIDEDVKRLFRNNLAKNVV